MKSFTKIALIVALLLVAFVLVPMTAEAKGNGGGKSFCKSNSCHKDYCCHKNYCCNSYCYDYCYPTYCYEPCYTPVCETPVIEVPVCEVPVYTCQPTWYSTYSCYPYCNSYCGKSYCGKNYCGKSFCKSMKHK